MTTTDCTHVWKPYLPKVTAVNPAYERIYACLLVTGPLAYTRMHYCSKCGKTGYKLREASTEPIPHTPTQRKGAFAWAEREVVIRFGLELPQVKEVVNK